MKLTDQEAREVLMMLSRLLTLDRGILERLRANGDTGDLVEAEVARLEQLIPDLKNRH